MALALDEVFVKINGEPHYLRRAVDHEGEVLEVLATKRRDRTTALKVLKRPLKHYGQPGSIVTDRLRSYGAAMEAIGIVGRQDVGVGSITGPKTHISRSDEERCSGEIQKHQDVPEICRCSRLGPKPLSSGPPPQPPYHLQAETRGRSGRVASSGSLRSGSGRFGDQFALD
jgi:hypothetical protein